MNFLAHLHTSPNLPEVRVFNFTGDGFRGNLWKNEASTANIIGVELHRFTDTFTDQHPLTKAATSALRPAAGRTASIALDLFGDYFLHKYWEAMSPLREHTKGQTCQEFIQQCYAEIEYYNHLLAGKAQHMWPHLYQENWLGSYRSLSGIRSAARGMSTRHKAVSQLGDFFNRLYTNDVFYQIAEEWFLAFYPKLLEACEDFYLNHPLRASLT